MISFFHMHHLLSRQIIVNYLLCKHDRCNTEPDDLYLHDDGCPRHGMHQAGGVGVPVASLAVGVEVASFVESSVEAAELRATSLTKMVRYASGSRETSSINDPIESQVLR